MLNLWVWLEFCFHKKNYILWKVESFKIKNREKENSELRKENSLFGKINYTLIENEVPQTEVLDKPGQYYFFMPFI